MIGAEVRTGAYIVAPKTFGQPGDIHCRSVIHNDNFVGLFGLPAESLQDHRQVILLVFA
jgi:hypothetical protein